MSVTVLSPPGGSALVEPYLTVEAFLASEELSDTKDGYLGGVIHAMTGAGEPHNRIALNLTSALHTRLRGRRCEPFGSDMKVRINFPPSGSTYLCYPDAMVACNPADAGRSWRRQPAALFEIISESTRQIDEREKRAVYLSLGSLEAYVRIEQGHPEVVVERRTIEGWQMERLIGLDAVIHLPTLEIELPLAELYERITFPNSTDSPPSGAASA